MKKKRISVSIVGTGSPVQKDLDIEKGVSTRDLKRDAGISAAFQVVRKTNGEQLKDGDDLYEVLQENEILIATPPSTVGDVRERIAHIFSSSPKVSVVNTYDLPVQIAESIQKRVNIIPPSAHLPPPPVLPLTIKPAELRGPNAELEYMGFVWNGREFLGTIADDTGMRYNVKILQNYTGYILYIQHPPVQVLLGSHGMCFRCVGNGWYWVHFNENSAYGPGMVRSLTNLIRRKQEARIWPYYL